MGEITLAISPFGIQISKHALFVRNKALLRAGDGNRTHVTSLEGWSSTIELHPRYGAVDGIRTRDIHLGKVALYQLSYYRISAPEKDADEET